MSNLEARDRAEGGVDGLEVVDVPVAALYQLARGTCEGETC